MLHSFAGRHNGRSDMSWILLVHHGNFRAFTPYAIRKYVRENFAMFMNEEYCIYSTKCYRHFEVVQQ